MHQDHSLLELLESSPNISNYVSNLSSVSTVNVRGTNKPHMIGMKESKFLLFLRFSGHRTWDSILLHSGDYAIPPTEEPYAFFPFYARVSLV